jgi:tRNA-splicing ligase RtcB
MEPGTIEQAERTARLPIIEGHVALMPDAHVGLGATVGSVIATRDAVIPSAVGVDIGCGMIAARTDLTSHDLPDDRGMGALHHALRDAVPAGLGKWHADAAIGSAWLEGRWVPQLVRDDEKLHDKVAMQYGTLGSGNHFLEVCLDETDRVWIVLHSGSRGVGKILAEAHIKVAEDLNDLDALEDPALASLAEGTPAFAHYIEDMLWAQDYARANRDRMMANVVVAIGGEFGREVTFDDVVNAHHNFCVRESHRDVDVWVTRKGAIRAGIGDRGVIPGSMATGSYIVTGLGNEDSWTSCSHGAGRVKSRGQARRELTVESLTERMAGKAWNDRDAGSLVDEHPDAYKSVEQVMAAQTDLVRIDHTLTQVLNVKGTDGGRRERRSKRAT